MNQTVKKKQKKYNAATSLLVSKEENSKPEVIFQNISL